MKLNTMHSDLKQLYKDRKEIKSLFAFDFTCDKEKERVMQILKKGYWSVMPFAFETYNNFAVKLHPKNKINKSAIVQIDNSDGVTVAASLKTFLPIRSLKFLKRIKLIKNYFISKRVEFEEVSLPFRQYTNGVDSLDFLYSYISNPENLERIENTVEGYKDQMHLDFWNHYNQSQQQDDYARLITKLDKERKYYPKFKEVDYGIWNTRVYNALAKRAHVNYKADFAKREKYLWKSLTQIHGFDSVRLGFHVIPDSVSDSSISKLSFINEFDPDLDRTFSKEVLEHPLYDAIQDLRVRRRGYMGELHVEAAAIFDTELNDPYAAWDALVTASYWAGQAGSKAIEPMWEAAIYLSEKHNWKEIHEVLVQQYEYYNYYKNKV